jgi:5'-nucleotidase
LRSIDLTLGRNDDIKSVRADNVPIYTAGKQPVADVQALIDRYDTLSAPLRRQPVGRISDDIRDNRNGDPTDDSGEFPAGNLIADAQLADTEAADRGGAVVALMNPGGVRSDFLFADSGTEGDEDGLVTYEEAFTVQPFNNLVTTQTFTGAQLLDVLKDQWCGSNTARTLLLPSQGFHYTYDAAVAEGILGQPCAGAANPVSGVTINGVPLDPAATYRVTTNNFLADGGDDFPSLTQGTDRTTLDDFDIDSLVRYMAPTLEGASPIDPPALDRVDVE